MIYIHIPFCDSKCYYCDFCSNIYNNKIKEEYFKKLNEEIKNSSNLNTTISSIYIGGGTPSSVDSKYILEVLNTIKENFKIKDNAEITIEANPCSVNYEKLLNYIRCGINRISFGVQSLNNKCLKMIGRKHDKQQAINAIKTAKEVGFNNISCDTLIGIPHQNYLILKNTIKKLIKCGVNHISSYMLINEKGTVLTKQIENKEVKVANDDKCVSYYNKICKFLKSKHFYRYEISNFSNKGYESKHNIGYWKLKEYYGFGLSAHSYINGKRIENTKIMKEYLSGNFVLNEETIDNSEQIEECIMLGLRMSKGVSVKKLNELGYDIFKTKDKTLKFLKENGFVDYTDDYIFLTENSFGVCNDIILKLLP